MSGGENEKSEVWNTVLRAALSLPGARISRESYLRRELSKHLSEEVVEQAISATPAKAGISPSLIRSIAMSSIKWHRAGVTATSTLAGIPGGPVMVATIPTDLAQFFWHVSVILQKLAYLHGWPEIFEEEDLDDETLLVFTVFIGVMFGAATAAKVLGDLAERVASQVLERLPREALTKWGVYKLAKQVAKWIGIRLTKQGFARAASKVVPVLSGLISGTVSWVSFSRMSRRLLRHLEKLPPHTGQC